MNIIDASTNPFIEDFLEDFVGEHRDEIPINKIEGLLEIQFNVKLFLG